MPVELKKENDVWKITSFTVPAIQQQAIAYYIDRHKGYVSGLKQFRDDLKRERMLKDQVATNFIHVLGASK
jgi:hypothetical protein